jgi:TonB family protein
MKSSSLLLRPLLLITGALALPCQAQPEPRPYPAMDSAEARDGQLPQLVSRVDPLLPSALAGQAINEDVHVAFVVDQTGRPLRVRVFFSHHDELEAPAIEAVKQWKFTPGVHLGRPVCTQMVVAFRFRSTPTTARQPRNSSASGE